MSEKVEVERPVLELKPSPKPGQLPGKVLDELAHLKAVAIEASEAFSDAIKEQAKVHRINKAALRRYVVAYEGQELESLGSEVHALMWLHSDFKYLLPKEDGGNR